MGHFLKKLFLNKIIIYQNSSLIILQYFDCTLSEKAENHRRLSPWINAIKKLQN